MAEGTIPIEHWSVARMVREGAHLLDGHDFALFYQLFLTGAFADIQVSVDPLRYPMSGDHSLSARRDYGSVLGISHNIVVHAPLTLFLQIQPVNTLTDMHIHLNIINTTVHGSVPVHLVPNVRLGEWGGHNSLFALILGLYEGQSNSFTAETQRTFYEKGFWPAIHELSGDSIDMSSREFSSDVLTFPEHLVCKLADAIRGHLHSNDVPWWAGVDILHHIQADTVATSHDIDTQSASNALEKLLISNNLLWNDIQHGHWYIDVGLDVSSDIGHCLVWRTGFHASVLRDILQIPDGRAAGIVSNKGGRYTRQMSAHMPALSGFEFTSVPAGEGPFRVCYAQAILTNQSIGKRLPGGRHTHHISGITFLDGTALAILNDLYDIYRAASLHDNTHARVEMRVPINFASCCLFGVTPDSMRQYVISFPKDVWWTYHAYRVLAIHHVLLYQLAGGLASMTKRQALLLAAASIWLINSLHSAPDLGALSIHLLSAVLTHEVGNGPVHELLPVPNDILPPIPFGVLFVSDIAEHDICSRDVPRFRSEEIFVCHDTFYSIFSMAYDEVTEEFLEGLKRRSHFSHHPSNSPYWTPIQCFEDNSIPHIPSISDRYDFDSERYYVSDGEEAEPAHPLPDETALIWSKFISDGFGKIPAIPSGDWVAGSYCALSAEQRRTANEANYMESDLSITWKEVQWKIGTQDDHDANFQLLFPQRITNACLQVPKHASARYYSHYTTIINHVRPRTAFEIRKQLRQRYDRLFWVPQAGSNTMWTTSRDSKFSKFGGRLENGDAPKILVRSQPKFFK